MTVQKAIKDLKFLIEHRQKVLSMMKGHVDKMQSDSGKDLGNTLIQVTEKDISNFQQILKELEPESKKILKTNTESTIKTMIAKQVRIEVAKELKKVKHDTKRKKKSL